MIQAGATQFEAESLAAIERIDALRRKATDATPLPREKASAVVVEGVKNSTEPITLATLRVLINPLKSETPQSEAQWQALLQKMRQQYTTFAATFASLDKGSCIRVHLRPFGASGARRLR
jgi:endonuclease/exonuclease/phosphatase (EEP) superfamily protein YafD